MANIWVRKPIAVLQAEAKEGEFGSGPGEAQLRRTLSLWSLVALGIGAVIGAGIFVLTGHAAAANAGPAISLSFVLAGIVCAFADLCYAEMASTVPIAKVLTRRHARRCHGCRPPRGIVLDMDSSVSPRRAVPPGPRPVAAATEPCSQITNHPNRNRSRGKGKDRHKDNN
jgi:hypothetical protein